MISLLGSPRRACDGTNRRDLLVAGGASLLGGFLNSPGLTAAQEEKAGRPGKAKSVIMFFLFGGAATQDMWDLKPDAPAGVRGEFKPIATSAPGVTICDQLPRMAKWMHKSVLIRSTNHHANCHNALPAYTGFEEVRPDNQPRDTDPPSMGSVCEFLKKGTDLPHYVCLPNYTAKDTGGRFHGQYAGFLGKQCDPLFSDCKPSLDPGTRLDHWGHPPLWRGRPFLGDAVLAEGVTLDRLDSRRTILQQFDDHRRVLEGNRAPDTYGHTRTRAFKMLTGTKLKAAFNLDREDPRLLDRYGRTLFGESTLIARKLVETGVRFVNVTWDVRTRVDGKTVFDPAWDTHTYNFEALKRTNLPVLDQTFSALMWDLSDRGLLEETLVLITSDFGRTPHINKDAGRDHWIHCYTTLMAGAGLRGGGVYGSSDSRAAIVKDNPVSPADVCATVYHCLGIDPDFAVHDRGGRPIPVANGGRAIREILG